MIVTVNADDTDDDDDDDDGDDGDDDDVDGQQRWTASWCSSWLIAMIFTWHKTQCLSTSTTSPGNDCWQQRRTQYIYTSLLERLFTSAVGLINSSENSYIQHVEHYYIITALSELRKVLFLAPSVCVFVRVWNISGTAERICSEFTRKTCLVPRSDEFEDQRSRLTGIKKTTFSVFSAACVRFVW